MLPFVPNKLLPNLNENTEPPIKKFNTLTYISYAI